MTANLLTKDTKDFNSSKEVWVVVPAYNEENSIGKILEQFEDTDYSVLVIDDNSTDHTVEITSGYPITLLKHSVNLGQGASLQTGFHYIVKNTQAKYVVTFDSDGQHDIGDIPKMLAPLISGQYDITLGSRFLKKGSVKGITPAKLLTLKAGILFTRLVTGLRISDTHNGLRGLSIQAIRKIRIKQNRMAHASEILSQISKLNLRYCEVPVTIRYTKYSKEKGQSIFNSFNILWELLFGRD